MDGCISKRFILPFFLAIYPVCFYIPILAHSKLPPIKHCFPLTPPKPFKILTALLHLFFSIGALTPLWPSKCHHRPWGSWLTAGDKQRLVWPANGLFPQPRQQLSPRMWQPEACVAAGRLREWLMDAWRTSSGITACLTSVREGAKSMNTQQINSVGVFFFGNVIFSIRMLTNAPLIAHSTASAVWYPRPEEMQNHKKKDSNWSRELYNHMIQLAGFIFVSWVPYFLKPEIHSHTMEALYYL